VTHLPCIYSLILFVDFNLYTSSSFLTSAHGLPIDKNGLKSGLVSREGHFLNRITTTFTPYYQPLIPWVNKLRKVVFPTDGRWEKEDRGLYSEIKEIL